MMNKTQSLKAKPTEYRGFLYRSKCEAMFARYLELRFKKMTDTFKAHGFEYEPEGMSIDGWTLDFLDWHVHASVNSGTGLLIPTIHYEFIEYKPSVPTKAYLSTLGGHFESLNNYLSFYDGLVRRSSFYCYFGSVFSETRGRYEWNEYDNVWSLDPLDWVEFFEDDMRSTRFDLQNA